jgi:hypothetical protein
MSDDTGSDQGVRRRLGGVPAASLRASDAEREAAVHALTTHFTDGRLDRSEFDERVEAALAARTQRQIETLFADLPGPAPALASRTDPRVPAARAPGAAAAPSSDQSEDDGAAPGFPLLLLLVPLLMVLTVGALLHGVVPIFPIFALLFILGRRGRRLDRSPRPWT